MSAVLEWVKSNVVIVIFAAVMVAAVPALLIASVRLNAGVKDDVKQRTEKLSALERLEKTNVTIGGTAGLPADSRSILVNQSFLDRFKQVTQAQQADAEQVFTEAVKHNRKGRGVLMEGLFPHLPAEQREVLPKDFHDRVNEAYVALLNRINGDSPPTIEDILEEVQRRRAQFYSQTLQKDLSEPLTEEEEKQLRDELTQARKSRYYEAADTIKLYVSLDLLKLPDWDQEYLPSMSEMFEWQWQYWLRQDILEALAEANRRSSSVLRAPVKRVTELTIYPGSVGLGEAAARGSGGGSGSSGGTGWGLGGGPGRRSGGGSAAGSGTAVAAAKPDPKKEIKRNYSYFTGRYSNPLYDVRWVQLGIIVDTARIPDVLNALARQNFITVIDLQMTPVEPYAAAREGYLYGSEPVSQLNLQLETIWLRSWTTQYMPDEVKMALGVPVEKPEQPTG